MNKTKIEYLNYTWNPLAMKCSRISEGCQSCWHISMAKRLAKNPLIDKEMRAAYAGRIPVLNQKELEAPLHLRKPSKIGVQFMGDLFHDDVFNGDIASVFEIIEQATQHIYMLLTKRPQRMVKQVTHFFKQKGIPDNLWLGVSVENQKTANERIPILIDIPAKVLFVSYEPALELVDFTNIDPLPKTQHDDVMLSLNCLTGHMKGPDDILDNKIGWVICGAETGPAARPMNPDWARSVRDQCKEAGVPFFFKQISGRQPIPDDLMIREWPNNAN